jgi:arylsulfatase A-like enzyme
VPLIVSAPGQPGRGKKAAGLTELVDLYPSLCEICDLPRPPGLEGSSFLPIFEDPERLWKRAVFSQYPREIPGAGPGMGRSMRTRRYRYTEWRGESTPYLATELYDYETDPGETTNIAGRPQHISLVNGLAGMLHDGWRSSLPPTEGPA